MLAGLLLVVAVLYVKGYWAPVEVVEEPQAQVAEQEEPVVVRKNVVVVQRHPGAPEDRLPEPTTIMPEGPTPEKNDLSQRAIKSFNSGNYDMAINLFSELARTDRSAYLGLGLSYYKLGDYRSSADFLEQAIGVEGVNDFLVLKFLAFTYYRLDELDESKKHAEAALNINDDPDIRMLISKISREKPAQDDFIKDETLHFKVLFDGYEHSSLSRRVLYILEEAYNTVGAQMNHFPRDPITVILYNGKEYHDVTMMPKWSGGAFDGKMRLPISGMEEQHPEELRRILFHEYTHALIYSITLSCPRWIHEGLATTLSGEQRQLVGQEIPLRSLERDFPRSQRQGSLAYDVSYSAVHDLVQRNGMYSFKIFLTELSKGQDIEDAFKTAFLISYSEFIDTWGKE